MVDHDVIDATPSVTVTAAVADRALGVGVATIGSGDVAVAANDGASGVATDAVSGLASFAATEIMELRRRYEDHSKFLAAQQSSMTSSSETKRRRERRAMNVPRGGAMAMDGGSSDSGASPPRPDCRVALSYLRRAASTPITAEEVDGVLTIKVLRSEMPTVEERAGFNRMAPPAGSLAGKLRKSRRIDPLPTTRVIRVVMDGTCVARWVVGALSEAALVGVYELALDDLNGGGDVKTQTAAAGAPNNERLRSALRLDPVRKAYGLDMQCTILSVGDGTCVYLNARGEQKCFKLSANWLAREARVLDDSMDSTPARQILGDEIDVLAREHLEAMGYSMAAIGSSRVFAKLFSNLTDSGRSVTHGHLDANDAIPTALATINPLESVVTTGGELMLLDGALLLPYRSRDVVFLLGSQVYHSVMRLGVPSGQNQADARRYSVAFVRHRPRASTANYVSVRVGAPNKREVDEAAFDARVAKARRLAPSNRRVTRSALGA